jgi:hypothetical protein
VKNKYFSTLNSVKDAAGWLYDLPIRRVWQLSYTGTTFWLFLELLDMGENALNEGLCSVWFVEGYIIGDGV